MEFLATFENTNNDKEMVLRLSGEDGNKIIQQLLLLMKL
jgi:hypothetical protein